MEKWLVSSGLRYPFFSFPVLCLPILFHGLRHTFATRCIESQCDYKTVSVILGHSNVATTLNLYVHPNLNQKKRCIDRMSNFLGIT
ncbi:tyrosine-type recombinase/integrase [Bacteroides uniformis]|uniref:tyrosine-type recombinase/integrase n=1 Tax=Bacteroides uniformis TaxID=820 RepID=UPI0035BC4A23